MSAELISTADSSPEVPAPRSIRVLVADDCDTNRAFARGVLGKAAREIGMSIEFVEADDGKKTLALLQAGDRFDLLILDGTMPGYNGMQVLERLGPDDHSDMRVVVHSNGLPAGHEIALTRFLSSARVHSAVSKDPRHAYAGLPHAPRLFHPEHAEAAHAALRQHTEVFYQHVLQAASPFLD